MQSFVLNFHGDLACFSRPELSLERFSYPCPPPSAARGVFDAIFCNPDQFRWQVETVEILHPVSYIALRRNEVKDYVNVDAVEEWMAGTAAPEPIWADADKAMLGTDKKGRTQRQTIALRDVRYRLHAHMRPWPGHEDKVASVEEQFRRRVQHGKCFQQPYFGCREFVAYFRLAQDCPDRPDPVPFDEELGWMLYDVFDLSRPGKANDGPAISVFRARIKGGVLDVPPYESDAVRKAVRVRSNPKESDSC
jgi:CRISPR-associated protein Cas5d